jgi:hypothetical protein
MTAKAPAPAREWFTVTEIAKAIGCHPRTISRDSERDAGGFPKPMHIGLSKRLYRLIDVIAYYQNRGRQ